MLILLLTSAYEEASVRKQPQLRPCVHNFIIRHHPCKGGYIIYAHQTASLNEFVSGYSVLNFAFPLDLASQLGIDEQASLIITEI